ncbi:MAG: hypothetical protein IEMM0002_0249 [bacterium]|nr:MAG: hypothetical protein IEMM0002_0249 [bacterium]
MSYILDALKKVEREKKQAESNFSFERRLFSETGQKASPRVLIMTTIAGLLALSSAVAWASIIYITEPKPTATVMTMAMSENASGRFINHEPHAAAGYVSSAPSEADPISYGGLVTGVEYRAAPIEEVIGANPPAPVIKKSYSSRRKNSSKKKKEPLLGGIIFHASPEKRSAMLSRSGKTMLVKIGHRFMEYTVAGIEPSSVILLKDKKPIILFMD